MRPYHTICQSPYLHAHAQSHACGATTPCWPPARLSSAPPSATQRCQHHPAAAAVHPLVRGLLLIVLVIQHVVPGQQPRVLGASARPAGAAGRAARSRSCW